MEFLYIKALHIIFIVSWFSALFYIVRLFIYTTEAQTKEAAVKDAITAQLHLMQRKLWYIIGWPAMLLTIISGTWMLFLNPGYYFSQAWIWLKLSAVALLILYHFLCQRLLTQQKNGIYKHSSFKLRLLNELATVFLVAIVFLAVVKSTSGLLWGTLGLMAFAGTLMLAVMIYRKAGKNK